MVYDHIVIKHGVAYFAGENVPEESEAIQPSGTEPVEAMPKEEVVAKKKGRPSKKG